MAQYGKPEYWDERYTNDKTSFDWYQRWSGLERTISEHLDQSQRILILGCGTSRMSEELFDQGYTNLINIDISSVAVQIMTEKFANTPKSAMPFKRMDVMDMSEFEDNSFDVVLDKATLDSLLCDEKATDTVPKMLKEVSRVIRDGGKYIAISYGQPQYRLTYLEREDNRWNVSVKTVPKPSLPLVSQPGNDKESVHYIYICKKTAGESNAAAMMMGNDDDHA